MKISIIGVGLIGGSLGMALRSGKTGRKNFEITGIDISSSQLVLARKLGAISKGTSDLYSGIKGAELVVIATPINCVIPLARKIWPELLPGTIVTDTASAKQKIVEEISRLRAGGEAQEAKRSGGDAVALSSFRARPLGLSCFSTGPVFVGGHPIAGLEKSGVEHARADLFRGATCILTPNKSPQWARNKVASIWKRAGAEVLSMSAATHDRTLAATSHLPHLIASALVLACHKVCRNKLSRLTGSAFRDATRVAMSSPDLWNEIFSENTGNLNASWKLFRNTCERILAAKASGSYKKLLSQAAHRRTKFEL